MVSLERVRVAAGETLALLGAPGAGKSTLLRALDGIGGNVLVRPDALLPDRTVAENITLGAAGAGRAEPWLHAFGLSRVAAMFPAQLGADALCRTALARALAGEPRLLQRRRGLGVVLATAQAPEARALADRVLVLRAGEVVQEGGLVEVYERPANAYAAHWLGEVNLLPARLDMIEDGIVFASLADGTQIEAMAADAEAGRSCVIAVRPERIALASLPPEELGAGAVAAVVEERVHHGDHVRLVLAAAGTRVVVRRPPGPEPAPGRAVSIAWQASHAHACLPER